MRGRPPNSEIRDRIVEILANLKRDYGYNIYKLYCRLFPKVSMRIIYYHLNKGTELGIFNMEHVTSTGEYSWGKTAEKVYYSLGSNAMPLGNQIVAEHFSKKINQAPNKRQEHK